MLKDGINLNEKQKALILCILPGLFIIIGLLMDTPVNIVKGIYNIVITPDLLITDYVYVGGLSAALVNTGLLSLINVYLLYRLNIKIAGTAIAALFMITGFAFFGKNIVNVWPIYLGGLLHAKYHGIKFKNIALIVMFSTALAPMVSQIIHLTQGTSISTPIGVMIGVSVGIFVGFIMPVLAPHMLSFHDGYNLYNVGFTAGIIGTVLTSVMRGFGLSVKPRMILSTQHDMFFTVFFVIYFIIIFSVGFIVNGSSMKGYKNLIRRPGRVVTDFTQLDGYGLTFMNIGIMGFIALAYIKISGGVMNGPIVGAMISLTGFSAFGNNPINTIPVIIGVLIAAITNIWNINSTSVIIDGLFGTTLAPIAGAYGPIYGIIAGFLHLSVVMNIGDLHGGMNLYNNGFSGGIVAAMLVPIIKSFRKDN